MSETTKADMIDRRSELLATVVLTRRLNVDVHTFGAKDQGIDLICTMRPTPGEDLQGFLPFGVHVWGTAKGLETADEATAFARSQKKRIAKEAYYIPVIVLLFSMQKDEGYFSWLVKPSNTSNKLIRCNNLEFTQFDIKQLDKMVNSIKKWYKRLETTIVVDAGESDSSQYPDGE